MGDAADHAYKLMGKAAGAIYLALDDEVGRFLDAQLIHLTEVRLSAEHQVPRQHQALDEQLALHVATNPVLRTIMLVDRRGQVRHEAPPDPDLHGSDLSGQPWLREAWGRDAPTWSTATRARSC